MGLCSKNENHLLHKTRSFATFFNYTVHNIEGKWKWYHCRIHLKTWVPSLAEAIWLPYSTLSAFFPVLILPYVLWFTTIIHVIINSTIVVKIYWMSGHKMEIIIRTICHWDIKQYRFGRFELSPFAPINLVVAVIHHNENINLSNVYPHML